MAFLRQISKPGILLTAPWKIKDFPRIFLPGCWLIVVIPLRPVRIFSDGSGARYGGTPSVPAQRGNLPGNERFRPDYQPLRISAQGDQKLKSCSTSTADTQKVENVSSAFSIWPSEPRGRIHVLQFGGKYRCGKFPGFWKPIGYVFFYVWLSGMPSVFFRWWFGSAEVWHHTTEGVLR